ncbi:MAG: hypothetical protein WCA27_27770 [Candidatus Sulfotelmatobacter sp.]
MLAFLTVRRFVLMIASLSANVCVTITVVVLTMAAHGQAAEEIPGAKQIDRRAMQEVCESSATISVDPNGHFRCAVCPSYTDFHGNRESFDLQAVYQGRFSTTNSEQLLLALTGCEPHASGFGGSILLTRDGTVWKKSAYFKGQKPTKCLSFKARDGLDRLVCFAGDAHFGTSASWISALSYKDNSLHAETLLDVGGNMALGSPAAGYCYEQDITTFEKVPSDTGFMVVVTQTRGLAPSGDASCGETEIRMEPTQIVNLNFQFDSDHFALAPASKDSLQKVENFLPHH